MYMCMLRLTQNYICHTGADMDLLIYGPDVQRDVVKNTGKALEVLATIRPVLLDQSEYPL